MNIRGLQRFTMVDYPGKMAGVIFTGGCNFRCPYCHNPCLVFDPESQPLIRESEVLAFLRSRIGKLDGVVISGGEPTLQADLPDFAAEIKKLGYCVKLDTNGSMPEVVAAMVDAGTVDALGVDYKGPADDYNRISGCDLPDLAARVHRVLQYATSHHVLLDVRTTVHQALLPPEKLREMRAELDELGIRLWTLQQFHPVEIINDELLKIPTYTDLELLRLAKSLGGTTKVRGLKGVYLE